LKAHHIPQRKLQLKDFFDGDNPFPAADTRRETVEHGCFACLGGAGDKNIQSAGHCCSQEPGRLGRQGPQLHEMLQPACFDHELPDVHRPMPPGDVGDDYVKP
jgi:hypothetical protein